LPESLVVDDDEDEEVVEAVDGEDASDFEPSAFEASDDDPPVELALLDPLPPPESDPDFFG